MTTHINKNIALPLVVMPALAVIAWTYLAYPKTLYATISPNQEYRAEVFQTRSSLFMDERSVYLNVSHGKSSVVRRKLLYTGDFLERDFRVRYPRVEWQSDFVLEIGTTAADERASVLRIINETTQKISYLLVETYQDKFVLLDFEPNASASFKFRFFGRLSWQSMFADSKHRLGTAVETPVETAENSEPAQNKDWLIRVSTDHLVVENPRLPLMEVGCCAVDRPDFYHE